jgi:hypothetical protein
VDPITEAVLKSWNLDTCALAAMLLTVAIYARGWWELRRQPRYNLSRLASFITGLAVIFTALFSPLDAFANLLLTAHMVQHLLLMMVAPPLILYSAPYLPLLRGLPRNILKHGVGPFLTWPALQLAGRWLTHPLVCLFTFLTAIVAWHLPGLYELAPDWSSAFMFVPPDWLLTLQILLLDLGLLLTLYIAWRIALRFTSHAAGALRLLAPWSGLALSLYTTGVWILAQPMQMRGMMM